MYCILQTFLKQIDKQCSSRLFKTKWKVPSVKLFQMSPKCLVLVNHQGCFCDLVLFLMLLCFHNFLTDNDGQVAMLHDKSILLTLAQCPSTLHLSELGFRFSLTFFTLPFLTFNFGFISVIRRHIPLIFMDMA